MERFSIDFIELNVLGQYRDRQSCQESNFHYFATTFKVASCISNESKLICVDICLPTINKAAPSATTLRIEDKQWKAHLYIK